MFLFQVIFHAPPWICNFVLWPPQWELLRPTTTAGREYQISTVNEQGESLTSLVANEFCVCGVEWDHMQAELCVKSTLSFSLHVVYKIVKICSWFRRLSKPCCDVCATHPSRCPRFYFQFFISSANICVEGGTMISTPGKRMRRTGPKVVVVVE